MPKNDKKVPILMMGMGFGMVKEAHADDYAPYFTEKGLAVFVFDYRRFGRSEGIRRQRLYPMDQVSDYRCAISSGSFHRSFMNYGLMFKMFPANYMPPFDLKRHNSYYCFRFVWALIILFDSKSIPDFCSYIFKKII